MGMQRQCCPSGQTEGLGPARVQTQVVGQVAHGAGHQVSIEKMSASKPSDDASIRLITLSKPLWLEIGGTTAGGSCVLPAGQAVFRWHELYTGLEVERGNLDCDVKGNNQWRKP